MPDFHSFENLRLAWIRTLSGENSDYRSLQRIEIDAFGWAEELNLKQLQKELREHIFTPSPTTKMYIPKASGMLRPITVLRIRDTIVYQAIANIIAQRARAKLSRYYSTSVFSNMLTSLAYPYFYRQWKYGRRQLDLARKKAFVQDYVWLGEVDLASFYDVIDHEVLRAALGSFCTDDEVMNLLFSCLSVWTMHANGLRHSHGVPQGPLPSSFVAECVLHLLDKKMLNLANTVYLRYVDDITIMSTNEKDAKRQFARIEIKCRELGLVPKVKRPIQRVDHIEDLLFDEPSPIRSTTDYPLTTSKKQTDAARKMFLSCFHDGKLNTKDNQLESKISYSLYRMNPDRRILNRVLSLLNARPFVADATCFYLGKYGNDPYICSKLFEYLESDPIYDYVLARCLVAAYSSCTRGQFGRLSMVCTGFLSQRRHVLLRSTAARILAFRRNQTRLLIRMAATSKDTYLTEHLLSAICSALPDINAKENLLNRFIGANDPETALTAAYLLTASNLKLTVNITQVNPWATPTLVSRGLTKKRVIGDRIGEILKGRYGVSLPLSFSFRQLLSRHQYKQALLHLQTAEGGFATNRSFWVTQMDCFNQILLFVALTKVGVRTRPDMVFGALQSTHLRHRMPNVAAVFDRCHKLRSLSPGPHAYSTLLGTFARDIKPRERDLLCKSLQIAYQEFITKI